ncbi:sulfite exporter TauE/SafE family protein [Bacteroidota bacterium]
MVIFWTAFLVGFFGSLHCIGMCGPIALALPFRGQSGIGYFFSRILYNTGRIITYTLIGAIIGLAGQGLSLAGAQRWLSIGSGILLILIVLLPAAITDKASILKPAYQFTGFLKAKFGILFSKASIGSTFLIGILNGFLPCGLVYVALAGALACGSYVNGMIYMAVFGLGTFPVMFAVSYFGKFIGIGIRQKFNRIVPVFIVALGILFILRGMNLGIPYISPHIQTGNEADGIILCH